MNINEFNRNLKCFELTDNDKKLEDEEQTDETNLVMSFLPVSVFLEKIFDVNSISKIKKFSIKKEAICGAGEVLIALVGISQCEHCYLYVILGKLWKHLWTFLVVVL